MFGESHVMRGSILGEDIIYKAALLLVLAFACFLSLLFFRGPSYLNGSDAFIYSDLAHGILVNGFGSISNAGVFSTRYILLGGIALSYALFGFNALAESLFGILAFLLTIILVFMMGRELYGKRAGLLSAFLYSFFPLAVVQSSLSGDDIVMAFFVTLAVFLMVLARRSDSRRYYLAAGFVSFIGILVTIESALVFAFLLPLLFGFFLKSRNRKQITMTLEFFEGVAIAMLIVALLGFVQTGDPLWVFRVNLGWYNSGTQQANGLHTTPPFGNILLALFSYNLVNKLSQAVLAFPSELSLPYLSLLLSSLWKSIPDPEFIDMIGYFGYATLLSVVYLGFRREKRALMPFLWFLTVFLYLSFGTMSLSAYNFMSYAVRFLLILVPSMCLLMGIGLVRVLEDCGRIGRRMSPWYSGRYVVLALVALGILVLLVKSIYLIQYAEYSGYASVFQLINASQKINTFPTSTTLYAESDIPVGFFTGYRYPTSVYDSFTGCGGVAGGSLIVVSSVWPANGTQIQSLAANCAGWSVILNPSSPSWFGGYSSFYLSTAGSRIRLYRVA